MPTWRHFVFHGLHGHVITLTEFGAKLSRNDLVFCFRLPSCVDNLSHRVIDLELLGLYKHWGHGWVHVGFLTVNRALVIIILFKLLLIPVSKRHWTITEGNSGSLCLAGLSSGFLLAISSRWCFLVWESLFAMGLFFGFEGLLVWRLVLDLCEIWWWSHHYGRWVCVINFTC